MKTFKWIFYVLVISSVSFVIRLVAADRKSEVVIDEDGFIRETIFKKDGTGAWRAKRTRTFKEGEDSLQGGDAAHPGRVNDIITRTGQTRSEIGKVPDHPGGQGQ